MLAELNRAKTTFFNNISHEFRTPLTLMLGPLEELLYGGGSGARQQQQQQQQQQQESSLTAEQKKTLTLVHRNGLRLLKLVNVLLDFSRIEAGRMQAAFRPVQLCALTAELASVFREACEKANIRLLTTCRGKSGSTSGSSSSNDSSTNGLSASCTSLSRPVYVDVDMWEKIILNLVSNAYKFTREGSIEVLVEEEPSAARVTVRDTGCGVAPHEMPRLFERFHRIQTSAARTHEGMLFACVCECVCVWWYRTRSAASV